MKLTQDEIVAALARGDKAAVVASVWPLIKYHAQRSPFTMVPFDDRVQLSALRFWNTLDRYDPTKAPIGYWVRRAAMNAIRDNHYAYRTAHAPKRLYITNFEVSTMCEVEERIELRQRLARLDDISRQWVIKNLKGEITASRLDGLSNGQRNGITKKRRVLARRIKERV